MVKKLPCDERWIWCLSQKCMFCNEAGIKNSICTTCGKLWSLAVEQLEWAWFTICWISGSHILKADFLTKKVLIMQLFFWSFFYNGYFCYRCHLGLGAWPGLPQPRWPLEDMGRNSKKWKIWIQQHNFDNTYFTVLYNACNVFIVLGQTKAYLECCMDSAVCYCCLGGCLASHDVAEEAHFGLCAQAFLGWTHGPASIVQTVLENCGLQQK